MSKLNIAGLALGVGLLTACQPDAASFDGATGVAVDDVLAAAGGPGIATTIRGVDFLIKPQTDTNFCIESENGSLAGRTVTLQLCSGSDFQRWGLPLFSDQTNIIIDQQGFCLDGRFSKATLGAAETVEECQAGGLFHFAVLGTGQIQNMRNQKCLEVPGAASNALVHLADCDDARPTQRWTFSH